MRNMSDRRSASPATRTYEVALGSVHRLASSGKASRALQQIVDLSSWRLRGVFRSDGNHSWYVAGDLLLKLDRCPDAIIAFRRALRAWSADRQAISALGYCYSELGKARLAERCFRRALALDSTDRAVRYNLGNALFDQGKYECAVDEYHKVIRGRDEISKGARMNCRLATKRLRESVQSYDG